MLSHMTSQTSHTVQTESGLVEARGTMQTSPIPIVLGAGLSWQRTRAAWAVSAVAPGEK